MSVIISNRSCLGILLTSTESDTVFLKRTTSKPLVTTLLLVIFVKFESKIKKENVVKISFKVTKNVNTCYSFVKPLNNQDLPKIL